MIEIVPGNMYINSEHRNMFMLGLADGRAVAHHGSCRVGWVVQWVACITFGPLMGGPDVACGF